MIRVLTAEQSMELWEKEKSERLGWSTTQILVEARMMMSMPDMGNTKWVLQSDAESFYEWIKSDEGRSEWNTLPKVQHLAMVYAKKIYKV